MIDEMASVLMPVMERDPTSKEAQQAALLVINGYVKQADWKTAAAYARKFSKMPELGDEAFRAELKELYKRLKKQK